MIVARPTAVYQIPRYFSFGHWWKLLGLFACLFTAVLSAGVIHFVGTFLVVTAGDTRAETQAARLASNVGDNIGTNPSEATTTVARDRPHVIAEVEAGGDVGDLAKGRHSGGGGSSFDKGGVLVEKGEEGEEEVCPPCAAMFGNLEKSRLGKHVHEVQMQVTRGLRGLCEGPG